VSYVERHNEANGEDNRDGHGENYSANWGVEGETEDPAILETRGRVQRALLALVFFSHGTPMLLSGDEFGRTQRGNNNAYCQDNEISWLDWKQASSPEGQKLAAYVARLIALRHAHPVLRCRHFLHGKVELAPGVLDIDWYDQNGEIISSEAWNSPEERLLMVRRAGSNEDGTVSILTLLLNPSGEDQRFQLRAPNLAARVLLDSADPETAEYDLEGQELTVKARSAVLTFSLYQDGAS
jgi:glycogen operon protein